MYLSLVEAVKLTGTFAVSFLFPPAPDMAILKVCNPLQVKNVENDHMVEVNYLAVTPRYAGQFFGNNKDERIIVVVYSIDESRVSELNGASKESVLTITSDIFTESLGIADLIIKK